MITEVEKAEAVIKALDDKRQELIQKQVELDAERQKISFAAHAGGDSKARKRLNEINLEVVAFSSEMASLESAIVEANSRLVAARHEAATAADRAKALELRKKLERFKELGEFLNEALEDAVSAATEIQTVVNEMHALGAASPNHAQVRVNATLALKAFIMRMPWTAMEWEYLAPGQRVHFDQLIQGWSKMIESNISSRIGEEKAEAA